MTDSLNLTSVEAIISQGLKRGGSTSGYRGGSVVFVNRKVDQSDSLVADNPLCSVSSSCSEVEEVLIDCKPGVRGRYDMRLAVGCGMHLLQSRLLSFNLYDSLSRNRIRA